MTTVLNGLPPLAVAYGQMAKTFEAAGWLIRSAAPAPDDPITSIQLHLYHHHRRDPLGDLLRASVIVTQGRLPEPMLNGGPDVSWLHASIYLGDNVTPTYEDLATLHRAVFGRRRHAWQCFVPASAHVNIKQVLHLWGRVDGANMLPDFGALGMI